MHAVCWRGVKKFRLHRGIFFTLHSSLLTEKNAKNDKRNLFHKMLDGFEKKNTLSKRNVVHRRVAPKATLGTAANCTPAVVSPQTLLGRRGDGCQATGGTVRGEEGGDFPHIKVPLGHGYVSEVRRGGPLP